MAEQEAAKKEIVVFGELNEKEAIKTEGGYVIMVQGTNDIAPETSFAIKVNVPEDGPSQTSLQKAFQIFGNTVGLKAVGIIPSSQLKDEE